MITDVLTPRGSAAVIYSIVLSRISPFIFGFRSPRRNYCKLAHESTPLSRNHSVAGGFSPTVIDKSLAKSRCPITIVRVHGPPLVGHQEGIMHCSAGFILNMDTPTKLLSQRCNLHPCSSQAFARSHFLSVKQ